MNKEIQLVRGLETNNSKGSGKFNSFLKNTKKFIAFTLAETLIVMGIIGVVAALTIPNLNSSTNNQEKVTKVKKIYAELNEAHNRATAVYGPINTWFSNLSWSERNKRYVERLTEFMKVQKICTQSSESCTNNTSSILDLENPNNSYMAINFTDSYFKPQVILSDGTFFFFWGVYN